MIPVFVNTPKGKKLHGHLDDKTKTFIRKVTPKDLMYKYDAWSINPKALKGLEELGVEQLKYITKDKIYVISMDDALTHGFEESYAGGPTVYIQLKFWSTPQGELI